VPPKLKSFRYIGSKVRDEVDGRPNFYAWENLFKDYGAEFVSGSVVHCPTHLDGDGLKGGSRAMYCCDPDGNAIEFIRISQGWRI